MINVVKENTGYYFPIDKVPASNEFILELYSELSLSTITFEDLSGEVQDDYVSIVITTEMCEQVSNGEYNYTLYDSCCQNFIKLFIMSICCGFSMDISSEVSAPAS